jgi:hypothetical protein
MAIVGVSDSSERIGSQSGIQKGVAGVVTNAASGTDYQFPDACDVEFAYLQSQLSIVNPVVTRWVMAEKSSSTLISTDAAVVGVAGGTSIVVSAVALKYAYLWNTLYHTVGSAIIPAGTAGVWGVSTRFQLTSAFPISPTDFVQFGYCSTTQNGGPASALCGAVSTTNFLIELGTTSVYTNTGIAIDNRVHTMRIYYIGSLMYAYMDNVTPAFLPGTFVRVVNGSSVYPHVTASPICYVNNGTDGAALSFNFYWCLAIASRVDA